MLNIRVWEFLWLVVIHQKSIRILNKNYSRKKYSSQILTFPGSLFTWTENHEDGIPPIWIPPRVQSSSPCLESRFQENCLRKKIKKRRETVEKIDFLCAWHEFSRIQSVFFYFLRLFFHLFLWISHPVQLSFFSPCLFLVSRVRTPVRTVPNHKWKMNEGCLRSRGKWLTGPGSTSGHEINNWSELFTFPLEPAPDIAKNESSPFRRSSRRFDTNTLDSTGARQFPLSLMKS